MADYEGDLYWRGPVWFNICWFMAAALRPHGRQELTDWIEKSLLQLVAEQGFYEYYNPRTGEGLGASGFSWTAALYIDLASRVQNRKNG